MNLGEYELTDICNRYHINPIGEYKIEWLDAKLLVKPERLDLISKIIYVDYYINKRQGSFAKNFYKRNLEVCTFGTFNEFDNEGKNSFQDYCHTFEKLIDNIKKNGFAGDSVIPVDSNGVIMDGAHRTAVAAFLDMLVPIVRLNMESQAMDAELYKTRFSKSDDIERALVEMCKWNDDLYLCCMWPAAEGAEKRKKAIDILRNESKLIYSKEISISVHGLGNLIPQIYLTHEWVGCIEDRFISAAPKIEGVSGKDKFEAVLFRADSLSHVKAIKEKMRSVFGIQENSLHITDYQEETLFIGQMLFSENTVAFLNKATPFHYIDLNNRIYKYKKNILDAGKKTDDFIIDSSTIMGLYGIRRPDDLDYLCNDESAINFEDDTISNHKDEVVYHKCTIPDIIYDANKYVYYAGLKVISLDTLKRFKENRNSIKDREDIKLINDYIENRHKLKRSVILLHQTMRRKARNAIYSTIRKLPGGGGTRRFEICIIY